LFKGFGLEAYGLEFAEKLLRSI
jgi:hypothetical protein